PLRISFFRSARTARPARSPAAHPLPREVRAAFDRIFPALASWRLPRRALLLRRALCGARAENLLGSPPSEPRSRARELLPHFRPPRGAFASRALGLPARGHWRIGHISAGPSRFLLRFPPAQPRDPAGSGGGMRGKALLLCI